MDIMVILMIKRNIIYIKSGSFCGILIIVYGIYVYIFFYSFMRIDGGE